jgi:Tol biopolymer transport system component
MTQAGMILGTAAYMSPEQARGKAADKRSDLWALGCVMYEMLTGRRAFEGDEVSDTLASVLKSEPDWTRLPVDTPVPALRLLARCLEKDRRRRLDSAVAARLEIYEALTAPERGAAAALRAERAVMPAQAKLAWMVALAAVVAAGVLAIPVLRYVREVPPADAPEIRFEINTPPTIDLASLAISPDGQTLVFAATADGRSQLWLRSLDAVSARPLAGTDGGSLPFWSPNNRSIGFFADGKLKRIEVNGGVVQTLSNAPLGLGGAWNQDDLIIFAPTGITPIFRVPAAGGTPVAITRLEAPRQRTHASPQFLPDGRHFLYDVAGSPDARGVYVSQLDGTDTRRLLDVDGGAVYRSPGSLLFVNQGTLFAQRFDPVRLALTGDPSALAEHITVNAALKAALSTSKAGPIVYRAGSGEIKRQFVWMDRSGKEIGKVGDSDSASPNGPSMSPNGRRVALFRTVNGKQDIWLLDVERGVLSRVTSDATVSNYPIWSPDGSSLVFGSNSKGGLDLYDKPATGAEREKPLLETQQLKTALDWSSDGHLLMYRRLDSETSYDIWALPLGGDRKPFPVVRTDFDERDGQFSPDGHWVAYQSNSSGRFEIYVQPFPGPGSIERISINGGAQVRWRGDGKEVYYIAPDGRLMAVPIRLATNGQAVEAGSPVPLFATHVGGARQGIGRQQYMVSRDGQKFLMNTVTEDTPSPITVILNWKPNP